MNAETQNPPVPAGVAPISFGCVNLDKNGLDEAFQKGAYIVEAPTPSAALSAYLRESGGEIARAACRINIYYGTDGAKHGRNLRNPSAETWVATA